jgi:hypothetical protein
MRTLLPPRSSRSHAPWHAVVCLGASALLACGGASTSAAGESEARAVHEAPRAVERRAGDPPWMDAVEALLARASHDARTYDHVAGLTDASGPRLAGSAGDALAVAWGTRTMPGLGLSNVRAEPVTVRTWVRGEERVEVLSPVPHRLAAAALGGSVGTPAGGLEGELVRVTSLEALRALSPEAARGRIVFVDQRMARAQDGHGYGETVPVRGQSASIAAGLGAIAVIIRSVGTDATRFPHTGAMRYAEGVPQIPAAAVSNPDADVLARWIEAGERVRVHLELGAHDGGEAQSANVIGEVPGSDHPEEIVLLGAHLDSWDLGRGAVDDGAGCAIVLEAARWMATAEPRPRRTVRVVLFANEGERPRRRARVRGGAPRGATRAGPRGGLRRRPRVGAAHTRSRGSPRSVGDLGALGPDRAPCSRRWAWCGSRASRTAAPTSARCTRPLPRVSRCPSPTWCRTARATSICTTPRNDVLTEVDRDSLDHAMRALLAVAYAASLDVE